EQVRAALLGLEDRAELLDQRRAAQPLELLELVQQHHEGRSLPRRPAVRVLQGQGQCLVGPGRLPVQGELDFDVEIPDALRQDDMADSLLDALERSDHGPAGAKALFQDELPKERRELLDGSDVKEVDPAPVAPLRLETPQDLQGHAALSDTPRPGDEDALPAEKLPHRILDELLPVDHVFGSSQSPYREQGSWAAHTDTSSGAAS